VTAVTPIWNIPYATGTDRLCDGYAILDSMAQQIEDELDIFTTDLERVVTIPYASISANTVQLLATNLTGFAAPVLVINYDTVNADTGDYTAIATLPSILTLPSDVSATGGYFAIFNQVFGFTNATAASGLLGPYIAVNSTLTDPGGQTYEDDVNFNVGGTFADMFAVNATTGDQQLVGEMTATNSGLPTASMVRSTFWMFWVSDQ
jgi:hypothetical protein